MSAPADLDAHASALAALAERMDGLEQLPERVDALERLPRPDAIAVPNEYYINPRGELATIAGLGEVFDNLQTPGMPQWLQSATNVGDNFATLTSIWTPTPGVGLVLTGVDPRAGENRHPALFTPSAYYNEGNILEPLLGPCMALMSVTLGAAPTAAKTKAEAITYKIRVTDAGEWPTNPFIAQHAEDPACYLSFGFFAAEGKIGLRAGGASFGTVEAAYPNEVNRDFWILLTSNSGGTTTATVYDTSPLNWDGTSPIKKPEPIVASAGGSDTHRFNPLHHQRIGIDLTDEKTSSEAERGAIINYFRVIPLTLAIPYANF